MLHPIGTFRHTMALQRSLFQSTSVRGTTFVGNYYKFTKRSTALARFSADDERSSRASINLNSATSLLLASVCASLGAASGALGMELAGKLLQGCMLQGQNSSTPCPAAGLLITSMPCSVRRLPAADAAATHRGCTRNPAGTVAATSMVLYSCLYLGMSCRRTGSHMRSTTATPDSMLDSKRMAALFLCTQHH